jgi:glycosyltransferase involved in cell wall biosynthesis
LAEPRYRVLAIGSHPVQYMAPLLRRMAQHPQLDLSVAYCTLRGAQASYDPDFKTTVKWDIPLLDDYPWQEIPNRGSGAESFLGLYNPGLSQFIRSGKFDAVLCYLSYLCASFWISYFACRRSGAAFIFGTDASSLIPRSGGSWKIAVKELVWPHLFGLADQVIAPSSAGRELMRSLGIPEERITLTPFVVDNDWWTSQTRLVDRAAIRESWGVGPHQRAVLFCGKLQSWKRPLDLLHAFAQADVQDTYLIFAGEGPLCSQLEAEACTLGISSRVRFLGFTNQSQLPAVYSAADLFVLPSGYDPCPVVVCEAMLCGLPVILSDEIRGRFDLVQTGVTGEIFPCGDVEALASALRRSLCDRERLRKLGQAARQRMVTWSPREAIAGTVDAVRSAVEHRRG